MSAYSTFHRQFHPLRLKKKRMGSELFVSVYLGRLVTIFLPNALGDHEQHESFYSWDFLERYRGIGSRALADTRFVLNFKFCT